MKNFRSIDFQKILRLRIYTWIILIAIVKKLIHRLYFPGRSY